MRVMGTTSTALTIRQASRRHLDVMYLHNFCIELINNASWGGLKEVFSAVSLIGISLYEKVIRILWPQAMRS